MISTTNSYSINSNLFNLDLREIPAYSRSSIKILQEQMHVHLPPQLHTAAPLTSKIQTMQDLSQKLQIAKDHSIRDKLIACIKGLFVASCIAATIFLAIYTTPPLFLIGLLSHIVFATWFNVVAAEKLGDKDLAGAGIVLGLGLVLPLYEGLTRVSRLEDSIAEQRKEIETTLATYHNENQQRLLPGYLFYEDFASGLLKQLEQKIEQLQKSLAAMEQLPERTSAGEYVIRGRLTDHQKTHDELTAVAAFYRKFQPTEY